MIDPEHQHEFTRTHLVMAKRFMGRCCVLDPQLIVPMRVLCEAFKAWAARVGHEPELEALRYLLEGSPWARLEERRARGRIRTVVHGVGFRPTAFSPSR